MGGDTIVIDGINYGKPNMAALEGKWGKEIFETIKNTPKPDLAQLYAEVEAEASAEVARRKSEKQKSH